MKIGMVFPSVEYGGQEKNLITLSNELHKRKYIIEIFHFLLIIWDFYIITSFCE